jgi:peroxiredoxin
VKNLIYKNLGGFVLNIFLSLFLVFSAFAQGDAGRGGGLGEALSQKKKTFSEKMPKEIVELYEKNIQEIKGTGLEKSALNVGKKAPDVMINFHGTKRPLSSVYGRGPVVLKFYRGGWCPYCMTELKHYDNMIEDFKKAGAQILAFAPDTEAMTKKTQSTHDLSFDVLSDEGHAIARQFGLVYKLDDKVVGNLKKNGIDISVYQGNNDKELSIPATYVVNKEGKIVFAYIDADYRQRAEPEDVLKAVKAVNK